MSMVHIECYQQVKSMIDEMSSCLCEFAQIDRACMTQMTVLHAQRDCDSNLALMNGKYLSHQNCMEKLHLVRTSNSLSGFCLRSWIS